MKVRSIVAFTCVALLAVTAANARGTNWIETWAAAPQPPMPAMGPIAGAPSFSDQTIRQIVRISAGGDQVRVRLSNEYGAQPLAIGAAHIAIAMGTAVQPGSDHVLTFGGSPTALIPPGAPLLSDPVALRVAPLSSLSISLYLPGATGPCTCHAAGMATAYVSAAGNFAGQVFTPDHTLQSRAFLSGVDVAAAAPAKTIVVLGDSISDGIGSTVDTNHRWPDLLADRLDDGAAHDHEAWGIANLGISGNRLLADGAGTGALARFDRDVLAAPGAAYVVVFEGINDIGLSYGHFTGPLAAAFSRMAPRNKVTAQQLIGAYQQLIARAHLHGLKVIGVTLTPYQGSGYYAEQGEAVREAVNRWIRTGGAFDGVLDFDRVLRDPADPKQIAAGLQAGDHLHGSDAGYAALVKSIDLSLFR